ncbi:MAG: glycosyltransferase family 2 protein [Massilibacteroides sp.]|nr:glycosyltransferase family 2 protein [Massilibacteroides sp.]MDD3061747.1 glycosyltransferase family 2 protein [Massilibacteroides sp.]MDD4114690.1 glycosyltransferase family 2 protein [Massilibacteroides sp.]MDD4661347.1 glycosyltransferase family 2 protein [Massilibacteroides sp.]
MYDKKVSIVIVNYNVCFLLEQCLLSVQAATNGIDAEIIVVDNHSTDHSMDYLQPKFPEVRFIENPDNPGFAKANNQAIKESRGEYILILNPDTVIGEESIRTLCFFMDEQERVGAVGVKMLDGHGLFLPESKRSFPTPWVSFCKLFGLSRLFPNSRQFSRYYLPYLNPDKQHKVDVLAGAFMFIRRPALDKAGLFDESFFMYGEDIDLSYRLTLAGYVNYYLPERILHYKGESTKHKDFKYIKAFYNAMLIFYKKYYPRSSGFMRLTVRSALGIKALWTSCFGRKNATTTRPKNKKRRLLILCDEQNFGKIKQTSAGHIPQLEFINHWNLNEERAMDAINRRNQMKGFTDIAFSYPDMRFEQMLLFMDTLPNESTIFHIYNVSNQRLISPGEKS